MSVVCCGREVMKALTVRQPWASLIIKGGKDVENRSRRTHYRGRIAVHVSLKLSRSWGVKHPQTLDRVLMSAAEQAWVENHDAGHIIGTVELVNCVNDHPSPWAFEDHWHWVLANPEPFDIPVPAKGKLGLWDVEL